MNRDADIIIHLWTPCVVRKTNVLYGCQSNSENKNRNESWWRSERSERPTRAIASEWTHENYFWKPWNKKEMRETESLVWKIFLVSEYFFMPHNFFVLLLFFWMGLFVLWKREWIHASRLMCWHTWATHSVSGDGSVAACRVVHHEMISIVVNPI